MSFGDKPLPFENELNQAPKFMRREVGLPSLSIHNLTGTSGKIANRPAFLGLCSYSIMNASPPLVEQPTGFIDPNGEYKPMKTSFFKLEKEKGEYTEISPQKLTPAPSTKVTDTLNQN